MYRIKDKLGCIIRKHRKDMDITQEQLAEAIGVTTGSIGQYERGETLPSIETLRLLLEFLGIDPREVFASEHDIDSDYVKLFFAFRRMTPVKQRFLLEFAQFLIECEYGESTN